MPSSRQVLRQDVDASRAGDALTHVLLVEDNQADAEFVELSLEEVPGREFHITVAHRLSEALEALVTWRPDVVLADIGLPDATGVDAVTAIQGAAPALPVIVLSGMEDERVALELIERGAQDYLVKGQVDPRHLARVIDYSIRRKRAEQALKALAQVDPLTGLANRRLFEAQLEAALARSRRSGRKAALLYLDLDGFKPVNDTFGHDVGDELLVEVAARLRVLLRETDSIARLGGDEFIAILENLNGAEDAKAVANKVVAGLGEPFQLAGESLQVGVSIGVAAYPDCASSSAELLRCADSAMYTVKRHGRNAVHVYGTPEPGTHRPAGAELESRLSRALPDNEFRLVYQPQVDLATGTVCGLEALLRWHPGGDTGVVMPGEFVHTAERSGLIVPIGAWVLDNACRQVRVWNDNGAEVYVSVNVSVRQLEHGGFAEAVARTLEELAVPHGRLELEITETGLMEDPRRCRNVLEDLKALGVRLAVDDFGTGYCGLNYLKLLPFDTVKLDRGYISTIHQQRDAAIVHAVIDLAHALGMRVVAEGVEHGDQLAALTRLGTDRVQGFLFGHPLPATFRVPGVSRAPARPGKG